MTSYKSLKSDISFLKTPCLVIDPYVDPSYHYHFEVRGR